MQRCHDFSPTMGYFVMSLEHKPCDRSGNGLARKCLVCVFCHFVLCVQYWLTCSARRRRTVCIISCVSSGERRDLWTDVQATAKLVVAVNESLNARFRRVPEERILLARAWFVYTVISLGC